MSASTVPDLPGDSELVESYLGGDQGSAAELVRRHSAAMGRFLYSAGAAPDDVDDLVQESLFRAFRALGGWRRTASFRSWLFSIAGNLLRDEFRRRKGRQVIALEDREIPDRADPHGELAASDMEERVRAGVSRLPRLQREVFLLRAHEGAGYDEIAAALGTTPGAARVHYHHAVKRLKELVR
ncbi:MAG: RNA polymerase sigma factor [Gemmatimonadales bacterium]|nr:RNA polymerase sigma factor [Gemmatimonadales bacterium]